MRFIQVSLIISALLLTSGCKLQAPAGVIALHKRFQSLRETHTVKKGETLYQIASKNGVHYRELAKINNIKSPYVIRVGQKLQLKNRESTTKTASKTRPKVVNVSRNHEKNKKNLGGTTTKKTPPSPARTAKTAPQPSQKSAKLSWNWPTRGPVLKTFSLGKTKANGIDIGGKAGDPIKAAASGKVVYSGNALRGYGNLIIIKHDNNFLSAYAHNRKIVVKEGERVRIGQRIAEMGQSGTDKVKLHFEVRYQGKPIDPMKVLPK